MTPSSFFIPIFVIARVVFIRPKQSHVLCWGLLTALPKEHRDDVAYGASVVGKSTLIAMT